MESETIVSDEASEANERPKSGIFSVPLAVAAAYGVPVAHDEFVGLDRLDRDELDETDGDTQAPAKIAIILPRTLRRTA